MPNDIKNSDCLAAFLHTRYPPSLDFPILTKSNKAFGLKVKVHQRVAPEK